MARGPRRFLDDKGERPLLSLPWPYSGRSDLDSDRVPKIALVAASYKRPEALATLLGSLRTQTLPAEDFEVAVVVDGIDETQESYVRLLEEERASGGLRLSYEFQSNAGPSAARNRAIRLVSAPWICIVDDDMELTPDFLDAHLSGLEEGRPMAVVIGKVIPESGWERQPLYEAMRTKNTLRMHDELANGRRPPAPAVFVTQNVSLSRELYWRVGGLDEQLRLGEDTELGFRLQFAGADFVFGPRAAAVHRSRIGSYEGWLERQLEYGRTSLLLYEKLGRASSAHPLRNLVTGNRYKAIVVHLSCWSDLLSRIMMSGLRGLGVAFQKLGLFSPAIATHNAIMAIAYHQGFKETVGSWRAFVEEERRFIRTPGRPLHPS